MIVFHGNKSDTFYITMTHHSIIFTTNNTNYNLWNKKLSHSSEKGWRWWIQIEKLSRL